MLAALFWFLAFVKNERLLFGSYEINYIVAAGAFDESYAPSAKLLAFCF